MYRHRPWLDESDDSEAANRQTSSLAGVVIILVLLIAVMVLALRPSAPPAYSPPAGSIRRHLAP